MKLGHIVQAVVALHYATHKKKHKVTSSSSSSSKEATRFSAAFAKCSILGSSSFLILVSCSGEGDGMVMRGCGGARTCEEGSTDAGLLGGLNCVGSGGLLCEVDVWDGEGEEVMEDEEGFFKESEVSSFEGDCDTDGCDCGVSVGFPSLAFLVPKNKNANISNIKKILDCFHFVRVELNLTKIKTTIITQQALWIHKFLMDFTLIFFFFPYIRLFSITFRL